jgi:hypothetical protein
MIPNPAPPPAVSPSQEAPSELEFWRLGGIMKETVELLCL